MREYNESQAHDILTGMMKMVFANKAYVIHPDDAESAAIRIATRELAYRIPRKPTKEGGHIHCPKCKVLISFYDHFCGSCGQKLDQ